MTLVSYEPWSFVNRLQRQLDQTFNKTSAGTETVSTQSVAWIPRVDIHEEAERFVVLADVPGVEAKDIGEGSWLDRSAEVRASVGRRTEADGFRRNPRPQRCSSCL